MTGGIEMRMFKIVTGHPGSVAGADEFEAARAEHARLQQLAARFRPSTAALGFAASPALRPIRDEAIRGKRIARIAEERRDSIDDLPAYLLDAFAKRGVMLSYQRTYTHCQAGVLVDLCRGSTVAKLYEQLRIQDWREELIAAADTLVVDPADPRFTAAGRYYAYAFYELR
jgi:hypothetical protein